MIDIHCHILPDIDDGPDTYQQSLAMAEMAAEDGIMTIVGTPHVHSHIYDHQEITSRVGMLNHLLQDRSIGVEILAGADVATVFPAERVTEFTINGSPYILVEFPHTHLPADAREILYDYQLNGLRPVITHPERNPSIAERPGRLLDLLGDNILVQLTAGSLYGEFGWEAEQCAQYLLRCGAVDVLATDAHSTTYRPPCLSKGYKAAAKIVGKEKTWNMVSETPGKIIRGEAL